MADDMRVLDVQEGQQLAAIGRLFRNAESVRTATASNITAAMIDNEAVAPKTWLFKQRPKSISNEGAVDQSNRLACAADLVVKDDPVADTGLLHYGTLEP